ncbi:MAG: hypothetical protein MJA32_13450 [Proteobacteria bacterium]|nr:hypothetical protein [Pseudomonadota bacterium]
MTTSDYLAMLRRRWRPTLIVFSIIALGTILIAYKLPAVYESSATILIEQQGIPTDFVQSTINAYAEQLVQTIYQRVVASDNVARLVEKHDLFREQRDSPDEADVLEVFRDSTIMSPKNVTTVHARTGREATITFGFQIDFQYFDPVKARDVARDIADMFVNYNAQLRAETASRTTAFLDAEAEDLQAQLSEVAGRIAAFKEVHANNLPEDQEVNLRTWERLSNELITVDAQLRDAREEIVLIETTLADTPRYRPVLDSTGDPVLGGIDRLAEAQQELIRLLGRYSEDHPEVISLRREIAALTGSGTGASGSQLEEQLRADLAARRSELAAARDAYSDDHPDVVALRRNVESLEDRLSDLERTGAASGAERPNNPVHIQLMARLTTERQTVADLNARRTVVSRRIADLERKRLTAPQVEREYSELTAERELILDRYRELRNLEDEAALGEALETGQSGERLTIVEAPRIPSDPVSPNRLSLSFLGVVLGIAIGLGTASLAEAANTKVRGRRDVFQILDAPPIGIIPYVESRADTVRRRTMNAALAAGLAGATAYVMSVAV